LNRGAVDADVSMPARSTPKTVLLRMRLPDGKKIQSVQANGRDVKVIDGETIDLSGLTGKVSVRAKVGR
jgi:hypothetical protein